jgi:hypothetical protein
VTGGGKMKTRKGMNEVMKEERKRQTKKNR